MKQALIAATALLSLAACSGPASPTNTSAALPALTRPQVSVDLYVADQGLNAVVEFDSRGNKVAQKSFGPAPLDVVTDSHGNVYLLTAEYVVHELTHNLSRVIRQYSPSGVSSVSLAIDANDNLYVQGFNLRGYYAYVARYPYGSSKADKIYKMPFGPGTVAGISVRGNMLFDVVESDMNPSFGTYLYGCSLNGSPDCEFLLRSGISFMYGCGFTTTHRYAVYGSRYAGSFVAGFHPYTAWRHSARKINLPGKYYLGTDYGFCNLHNYGSFVWGGMKTYNGSQPAVAVEFDMARGGVAAKVGAGALSVPVAAYYGNGFTP
jgi:hypothetical protein